VINTENTYAWIIATAISSVKRIIGVVTIIGSVKKLSFEATWLPNSVINRWPAIILAVRRIASVAGRIILLVVSINTIKGIRAGGVPCGIKCANIWLGVLSQPNIIIPSQIGSDIASVTLICLVAVNVYGVNPSRLVSITNENIEITKGVTPIGEEGVNNKENSEWSFLVIIVHGDTSLLWRAHQDGGIIKKIAPRLIQLINQVEDGSKTEKIFVIMFNRILFSSSLYQ